MCEVGDITIPLNLLIIRVLLQLKLIGQVILCRTWHLTSVDLSGWDRFSPLEAGVPVVDQSGWYRFSADRQFSPWSWCSSSNISIVSRILILSAYIWVAGSTFNSSFCSGHRVAKCNWLNLVLQVPFSNPIPIPNNPVFKLYFYKVYWSKVYFKTVFFYGKQSFLNIRLLRWSCFQI